MIGYFLTAILNESGTASVSKQILTDELLYLSTKRVKESLESTLYQQRSKLQMLFPF